MQSTLSPDGRSTLDAPKTTLVLWRDGRDEEEITVGSVTKSTFARMPRYTAWLRFHVDALLFLADHATYQRVKEACPADFPMPVELSIRLPEESEGTNA